MKLEGFTREQLIQKLSPSPKTSMPEPQRVIEIATTRQFVDILIREGVKDTNDPTSEKWMAMIAEAREKVNTATIIELPPA